MALAALMSAVENPFKPGRESGSVGSGVASWEELERQVLAVPAFFHFD